MLNKVFKLRAFDNWFSAACATPSTIA